MEILYKLLILNLYALITFVMIYIPVKLSENHQLLAVIVLIEFFIIWLLVIAEM